MWPLHLWDSKIKWSLNKTFCQNKNYFPIHHATDESWSSRGKSAVGVGVGVQKKSEIYSTVYYAVVCVGVIQWYTVTYLHILHAFLPKLDGRAMIWKHLCNFHVCEHLHVLQAIRNNYYQKKSFFFKIRTNYAFYS